MSRARSAENMIEDVRQRADMVGSDFVSDAEILEYLNQEIAELHGVIRRAEGQPHKRAYEDIAVTSGTSTYPLPATFGELLSVELTMNGQRARLHPFMEYERASLEIATLGPTRYRINGDNVDLLPATSSGTLRLSYIEAPPRLVLSPGSPNTFDGFNGYEVAAISGATATCLQKEESDPSFYLGQKDRIIRHIQAMAANRDGGMPERVTDVVGWNPWDI
jgi:hypothetical protein